MGTIKYALPVMFMLAVACGTDFATATPQTATSVFGASPTPIPTFPPPPPPLPSSLLADIPTPAQPTPTPIGWVRPEPPGWTPDANAGLRPTPFGQPHSPDPATSTPTPFGWVHPNGPPPPTSTPIVIPDHGFRECMVVDEFTVGPSGGMINVPLIHSTAVDTGPPWFEAYPAPEFWSEQLDASLKISFPGLLPTGQSEIRIERMRGQDIPLCLQEQFGDGPVWRVEPLDRVPTFEILFEVTAGQGSPEGAASAATHRLLLLTEAAEIKDLTGTWICSSESLRTCGRERRFGYVMLTER